MTVQQNKSIEERTQKAIDFFEQGYNCSQSVLMAYADLYGIDQETATKFASSFGGGMGRLREVCGAVSGMFMVLDYIIQQLMLPIKSKIINCEAVQRTAKEFKEELDLIFVPIYSRLNDNRKK